MSRDILVSKIKADPEQPRKQFDAAALQDLAQSMKEQGLIIPILLRPVDGGYIIVHGERRFRAAGLLGWETIPAEVREMTAEQARMFALIENVQRNDLSPIEEARAYQEMIAGGMTQTALGEQIGKSQSYIATKLRLLKMPTCLQLLLDRGALTEGHVKQLLRLDKFYDGERFSLAEEPDPIDWAEVYADPQPYIMGYLTHARPLDKWFLIVNENDHRHVTALDAMRALDDTWRPTNDLQPPAWPFTALWLGLYAYYQETSVAKLKEIIDLFISFVINAAMWLKSQSDDYLVDLYKRSASGKVPAYERELYYGRLADLRHARLSSWAHDDNLIGHLIDLRLIGKGKAFDLESYVLPTNVQVALEEEPEGDIAKRYYYLEQHDYYA